jgi:hypothetical protein
VFITDCLIPNLKEISEPMCMEETGEDRKLQNKEVFTEYYTPTNAQIIYYTLV